MTNHRRPTCLIKALITACLTASILPMPAGAQERMTLRAAVLQALENNPQVRSAERQIDAAHSREVQADAWPNPNFSLQADDVFFNNPQDGSFKAGITQPLLLGGQRRARMDLAKLERELAEFNRETVRRDLTAKVKNAFIQTLFEMAGERLAEVNAESAATTLKAVQARHHAGEVPQVEVLRAEVEHSRAQRDVAIAKNRALQSLAQLNVLMGREAQAELAIQDLALPMGNLPALPGLVNQALQARIELRQAEVSIQREVLQRQIAQAGLWTGTEVSIAAGSAGGQPALSGSLTLPIPFYRQQGEVGEAEANRLRAEAERDSRRNEITLEVEHAYREAQIAAKQAFEFQQSYLPQADRLLNNAQRRFQAGEGSGIEVLEARRAVSETRTEYQRSLLEYRRAIASLERAVGQDFPL